MNTFQKRITWRVLGIHAAVIVVVWLFAVMPRCFTPKPKEIVTFIEFPASSGPVSVEQVDDMPEPEPILPDPEPEPAPIPEPVKPQPKPIKKPPKKPIKPPEPKKTYTRSKDIPIGPRVKGTPKTPTLSSADIHQKLSGITQSSTPTSSNPSEFNSYYARVMRVFYNHWKPPASATGATVVRISMRKDGRITNRVKMQGSGDSHYDKTVMDAVGSVSMVPKPPLNYPYSYVEVEFRLGD